MLMNCSHGPMLLIMMSKWIIIKRERERELFLHLYRYVTDWHISASTASSDQDHAFQTVGGDPYTLTLAN